MTRKTIIFATAVLAAGFASAFALAGNPASSPLAYNPTESIPPGFYWRAETAIEVGDVASFAPPPPAHEYLRSRGYAGEGTFIKFAAALAGDKVCAKGDHIVINERRIVQRRRLDKEGQALPRWTECRRLREGEAFMLGSHPDSFDSRYYGPVSASHMKRMEPLWTF